MMIIIIYFLRFVANKKQLRAALDAELREEANLTRSLDEKGKLILEMKTSLQQINQLLSSVGQYDALHFIIWYFIGNLWWSWKIVWIKQVSRGGSFVKYVFCNKWYKNK